MSGWALVRERARIADTVVAAVAVILSAACLIPLFTDLRWVLPAVTVVVVISGLGAVSRGLGMPIPFVPVVQALGLVLTVTAMFAASEAWARIVPTTQAWDVLRGLLQGGLLDAQNYMAPVPTLPGMVLLAVGGVGLVALSTDTLFVSVRAPLLAGLPLLAMYLAVALTLRDGAPWWAFPLPAAGWLLILAADQRDSIRRWGGLADHHTGSRTVDGRPTHRPRGHRAGLDHRGHPADARVDAVGHRRRLGHRRQGRPAAPSSSTRSCPCDAA